MTNLHITHFTPIDMSDTTRLPSSGWAGHVAYFGDGEKISQVTLSEELFLDSTGGDASHGFNIDEGWFDWAGARYRMQRGETFWPLQRGYVQMTQYIDGEQAASVPFLNADISIPSTTSFDERLTLVPASGPTNVDDVFTNKPDVLHIHATGVGGVFNYMPTGAYVATYGTAPAGLYTSDPIVLEHMGPGNYFVVDNGVSIRLRQLSNPLKGAVDTETGQEYVALMFEPDARPAPEEPADGWVNLATFANPQSVLHVSQTDGWKGEFTMDFFSDERFKRMLGVKNVHLLSPLPVHDFVTTVVNDTAYVAAAVELTRRSRLKPVPRTELINYFGYSKGSVVNTLLDDTFVRAGVTTLTAAGADGTLNLGNRHHVSVGGTEIHFDDVNDELRAFIRLLTGTDEIPPSVFMSLYPASPALRGATAKGAIFSAGRNQGGYALVAVDSYVLVTDPGALTLRTTTAAEVSRDESITSDRFDSGWQDRIVFGWQFWPNQRSSKYYTLADDAYLMNVAGRAIAAISRERFTALGSKGRVVQGVELIDKDGGTYKVRTGLLDYVMDAFDAVIELPLRVGASLVYMDTPPDIRPRFSVLAVDEVVGAMNSNVNAARAAQLESDITRVTTERDTERARRTELETQVSELRRSQEADHRQIGEKDRQIETLTTEKHALEEQVSALRRQIDIAGSSDNKQLEELRKQLAECNDSRSAERDNYKSRSEALIAQVRDAENRAETLRRTLESRLDSAQNEIQTLRSELAKSNHAAAAAAGFSTGPSLLTSLGGFFAGVAVAGRGKRVDRKQGGSASKETNVATADQKSPDGRQSDRSADDGTQQKVDDAYGESRYLPDY